MGKQAAKKIAGAYWFCGKKRLRKDVFLEGVSVICFYPNSMPVLEPFVRKRIRIVDGNPGTNPLVIRV